MEKDTAIGGDGNDLKDLPDKTGSEGQDDKSGQSAEGKDGEGKDEKDKKGGYDIDNLLEGDEEEEVTVKRGSLKKVRGDLENYKTVALSKKKGGKDGKDGDREEIAPAPQAAAAEGDKPVTKKEVWRGNTKAAIRAATVVSKDDDEATIALKKEIDENWDAITPFYTGRGGKDDVNAIIEDIYDAHAAWKRRKGGSDKGDDGAAADLAANRGKGGASPKADQTTQARKRIGPPISSSPKDWYKKE